MNQKLTDVDQERITLYPIIKESRCGEMPAYVLVKYRSKGAEVS